MTRLGPLLCWCIKILVLFIYERDAICERHDWPSLIRGILQSVGFQGDLVVNPTIYTDLIFKWE